MKYVTYADARACMRVCLRLRVVPALKQFELKHSSIVTMLHCVTDARLACVMMCGVCGDVLRVLHTCATNLRTYALWLASWRSDLLELRYV
jgi:hypothetical protein